MILPRPERRPEGARVRDTPYYPMEVLNGKVFLNQNRLPPSCDMDATPRLFRRYMGGVSGRDDVQLYNGLRNRIATGWRFAYPGAGYLAVTLPQIPGQTRGNYGGFIPRGPSPWNYQDAWNQTAGSQPDHPGGPGKIAAVTFHNPMTG